MPLPSIGTGGPNPISKALVSNHESGSIANSICQIAAHPC
jgi:hypothetical protein